MPVYRQLLNDSLDVSRTATLVTEAMLVELNGHTLDGKEGVASFMERRPSEFKGWCSKTAMHTRSAWGPGCRR